MSLHRVKQELGFSPDLLSQEEQEQKCSSPWFSRINDSSFHYQDDYIGWR